jgi:undecaprenyl-diphosphatase
MPEDVAAPRRPLAPLLALAVLAAGLLGFAGLAALAQGDPRGFDVAVLQALRRDGAPVGPAWLDLALRDLTALGGTPVLGLVTLLALGWLGLSRRWRAAVLLLVSVPGGLVLNTMLKAAFDRTRPGLVPHLVSVQTESFPSSHAMMAAVLYLTIGAMLARGAGRAQQAYVIGAAVGLALLVGVSRVWLGVHWPTDVLAGWCLGAAWATGCWLWLGPARRHEA